MKILMRFLLGALVSLMIASPVFAAINPRDGDCEVGLVSRADYEGEVSRPWRKKTSRLSLEEKLHREFLYESTGFLADHLRWPNAAEAEEIFDNAKASLTVKDDADTNLKLEDYELAQFSTKFEKAMVDFKSWFPNRYFYVRRKIASAYIRGVRQSDLEKRFRTVATTPSDELFFVSAIKSKTNGGPRLMLDYVRSEFSLEHFKDLFRPDRASVPRQGIFPQPLIFAGGPAEVEQAARFDAPFAFLNFVNTDRLVTPERAAKTLSAVENSRGFIAISWTSGKPIAQDFLNSLIQMAEEKDLVILVGPTLQNFDGIPEIFLTHPRIHIVTETIENAALKISNEPINPDTENPLAGIKKPGRYRPGQSVIVFHPHQMMESVATGSNSLAPVMIMSTGSINEVFSPYSSASQGRTKESNKVFHKMKAWIFEKGDSISSFDPDGTQNIWHPRPVSFYDDRSYNGTAGFIDRSIAYQYRYDQNGNKEFERIQLDPEVLYLGDPHDPVTDPAFVRSLVEDLGLPTYTETAFQGGDTFDFGAISHWSMEKMVEMNLKFQKNDVMALQQVNGVIQMINALLQRYPNARYRQIVGNHDEWLTKLLDRTPDMQRVINGDFLDELNFAVKTLKLNIWEYIFKHREQLLNMFLAAHPDRRSEILRRVLPVYAPDRIDVLDRGAQYQIGPEHRKNDLARHGDRSVYGMKVSTLKGHAKAMPEGGGVTGHTHRLGIYGETMDPGAMAPVESEYGKGFDSAAGQALVAIYPNGTKQMWIFNRKAGTFHTRDPKKILPTAKFFGDDVLRSIPNDNQRVNKEEGLEQIWRELEHLRRLTAP